MCSFGRFLETIKNGSALYLVIDFSKAEQDAAASDEDITNLSKRLIEQNKEDYVPCTVSSVFSSVFTFLKYFISHDLLSLNLIQPVEHFLVTFPSLSTN